jgi:hypothetical protein
MISRNFYFTKYKKRKAEITLPFCCGINPRVVVAVVAV